MKKTKVIRFIKGMKPRRSKWYRAVDEDALSLLEECEAKELPEDFESLEKLLLNGARDWHQYSWDGCALIYNEDICNHYCTPSEKKRARNGALRPNASEDWLDIQTRALCQAFLKIYAVVFELK